MKLHTLNTQNAFKISFFKNHINRTNDYAKSLEAKKIDISHKLIYPHTHPQISAVCFIFQYKAQSFHFLTTVIKTKVPKSIGGGS